jgi:hypothetical protein
MTERQLGSCRSCSVSPNISLRESGTDSRIRCRIALEAPPLSLGLAAETDDCRG